jgi:4-methyl-5(b-hydroxyethyl)-thiazole monophosphate biosynthesis
MSKRAVVILAEGFEEIEAATPVDVLRRAGVEVVLAGLAAGPVKGAHGLSYLTDAVLPELSGEFDLLVLPGGMPGAKNIGDSKEAMALAEKMFAQGRLVSAICAAPVMTLGAWGMLDGKWATCYPGMEKMFTKGVRFSPERVVVDGTITTSRGPGTALEFSLDLARQLVGEDTAADLAAGMLAV